MTQAYPYNWYTPGEDEEDEELGIGVFRYPDGSSRYGQDPEGAAAMKQAGQYGPPPGAVAPPGVQDPNEYGPPPPPVTRNEPVESKSGDLRKELESPGGVNIPASSRLASVNNNPGNLRFAGQQGARQGEGGFAAFDTPEAGAAALYRQIDLDAGRGLTLGQFVSKYAPESENDTATYTKQMTEFTGASADTPISQIDRDKLAAAVARKESSSTLGGGPPPVGAPQSSSGLQIPGAPPGLVPAQVTQQGTPLTPQAMQEREGQINAQTQQEREMRGESLLNQRLALQQSQELLASQALEKEQNVKAQLQQNELIKQQADAKIEAEVNRPIQSVDPKRYIKNMSTAQQVFGVIGLLTSAAGQTLLQMNGMNAPNYALQQLDKSIDQDIAAQVEDIRQGEASSRNRVAYWSRKLDSAEQGKAAAKLEAEQAASLRLKAQMVGIDDANLQAQAAAVDQELQNRAMNTIQAFKDAEAAKQQTVYKPPKIAPRPMGPVPVGANDPIRNDPAFRAQTAAHFDETKNADELRQFKTGMDRVAALRATKAELEQLYKVQPDAQGNYPANGAYDSSATGIDPFDAFDELGTEGGATRARRLHKAWEGVRIAARGEWKTEPNGQQIQERFQNLGVPDRDEDVPLALQKLNDALTQAETLLESGTLPQVRAYFWSQKGPPVGSTRVTGRVP